jgi:hypothetical protein
MVLRLDALMSTSHKKVLWRTPPNLTATSSESQSSMTHTKSVSALSRSEMQTFMDCPKLYYEATNQQP